jgi:hypothetical protein
MSDAFKGALEVTRKEADSLFIALGFKRAATWQDSKMNGKLSELADLTEGNTEMLPEGDEKVLLKQALEVLEEGDAVILEECEEPTPSEEKPMEADESVAKSPPEEPVEKDAPPEEDVAPEKSVDVDDDEEVKAPKKKKRGGSQPGPRNVKNRSHWAGVLLRDRSDLGWEDLITAVDSLYGRSGETNRNVSKMVLYAAWQVIEGYLHGELPEGFE